MGVVTNVFFGIDILGFLLCLIVQVLRYRKDLFFLRVRRRALMRA